MQRQAIFVDVATIEHEVCTRVVFEKHLQLAALFAQVLAFVAVK